MERVIAARRRVRRRAAPEDSPQRDGRESLCLRGWFTPRVILRKESDDLGDLDSAIAIWHPRF